MERSSQLDFNGSALVSKQRPAAQRNAARALGHFAKLHFRTCYEVVSAAGKLDELPLKEPKEKTEWKR